MRRRVVELADWRGADRVDQSGVEQEERCGERIANQSDQSRADWSK